MFLGFLGGSAGKKSACNEGHLGLNPGWEDPLEEETATHSSILAWRIPRTEEPDALHSPWGHKESDTNERLSLSLCTEDLLPWDICQSSYRCSFISWVPFFNSILKYHMTNTGLDSKTKSLLNI